MTATKEKPAKTSPKPPAGDPKPESPVAQAERPDVYERLLKAYKVACPIVALSTADPAEALRQAMLKLEKCSFLKWDAAKGVSVPEPAQDRQKEKGPRGEPSMIQAADELKAERDLADFLVAIESSKRVKGDTVVVVANAHRFLERADVVQAIWNLRDPFKDSPKRMLLLMGSSFKIPAELQHDVYEIDEPLPGQDQLIEVAQGVAQAVGQTIEAEKAVDVAAASRGLTCFAAEQLTSLNLSRDGISVVGLWQDKCTKISETPGLRVVTSGKFSDVAGVAQAKRFLSGVLNGRDKPRTIVFVDEIEKSLGGASGDTSGVSQDQLGVLLQYMQDKRACGAIFVGPPGAAKSALAKSAGGEVGIPTIQFDLGGMKDSLVGGSEGRIRDALKVIDAVSGGKTLWLATCNSLGALPPELRRRFKFGTYYFGLPDYAERKAIWDLYTAKYELLAAPQALLGEQWTGAEIESCCEIAWRTGYDLKEAASFIVPVSKAGARQIEELETAADGKFLSASYPGVFTKGREADPVAQGRDICID